MKEVVFTLTEEEASFLMQVIGQLPTASNAYLLFQKMRSQLEAKE